MPKLISSAAAYMWQMRIWLNSMPSEEHSMQKSSPLREKRYHIVLTSAGMAVVCCHASQVLERFVLIFYRAFQPVFAVEIHHDAALVEALVALGEVCLHDKTEELLLCLHLKNRCIVVLEVIIGALPEVCVRSRCNGDGVALDFKTCRLSCPLKTVQVNLSAIGKCFFDVVCEFLV